MSWSPNGEYSTEDFIRFVVASCPDFIELEENQTNTNFEEEEYIVRSTDLDICKDSLINASEIEFKLLG